MNVKGYTSNTGYRFITKSDSDQCFRIAVHMPNDTLYKRHVGFARIGDKKGLQRAIELRDGVGKLAWGQFWDLIVNDPLIFTFLPHSLEPIKHRNTYRARWTQRNEAGEWVHVFRKRSITKHGALQAYIDCKRMIIEGNKPNLPLMLHMGRITLSDLDI